MANREHEQDIVTIYNPTNRDFTRAWGGVPRTIPAHQAVDYPRFLAMHIAKHMADFILQVKEYQHKKKTGREITLIRNRAEREKVMNIIVRGVKSYFLPDDAGLQRREEVSRELTDEEKRNLVDLGEVEDDAMGRLLDDVTIDVPEGRGMSHDNSKAEIMEQLDTLGIKYDPRTNKTELLKLLGVTPAPGSLDDVDMTLDPISQVGTTPPAGAPAV